MKKLWFGMMFAFLLLMGLVSAYFQTTPDYQSMYLTNCTTLIGGEECAYFIEPLKMTDGDFLTYSIVNISPSKTTNWDAVLDLSFNYPDGANLSQSYIQIKVPNYDLELPYAINGTTFVNISLSDFVLIDNKIQFGLWTRNSIHMGLWMTSSILFYPLNESEINFSSYTGEVGIFLYSSSNKTYLFDLARIYDIRVFWDAPIYTIQHKPTAKVNGDAFNCSININGYECVSWKTQENMFDNNILTSGSVDYDLNYSNWDGVNILNYTIPDGADINNSYFSFNTDCGQFNVSLSDFRVIDNKIILFLTSLVDAGFSSNTFEMHPDYNANWGTTAEWGDYNGNEFCNYGDILKENVINGSKFNEVTLYWAGENLTIFEEEEIPEEEPEQPSVTNTPLYQVIEGSGAGLGLFLLYLARALPILLLALVIVVIISVIGYSIVGYIRKAIAP